MKRKKTIAQVVIHVILVVLAVVCLTPFLSMISSSFMDIRGVLPDTPVIFPEVPLFTENYVKVWTANNFSRYFVNTLLISVCGLVINVLISVTMAYSFSRFKFPGREILFNVFLLTMMVPAQLALISQYTVLNGLHLIDNYAGVLQRADWRRENANKLVREIKRTILLSKPWVRFGISPFGTRGTGNGEYASCRMADK